MAIVDGNYNKKMRLSGEGTVELSKKILFEITSLVSKEEYIDVSEND